MIGVETLESLGKGKYRIAFDNGVICVLYGTELRSTGIREEVLISEQQFQHIITEIVGKRAKKRALHLLERMDRTEQQLREKLLQSEYPRECVEDAIAYVKSFHYIDDKRYAENFIRCSKEKMSRQQAKRKLLTKGVPQDIITQALSVEYDADESLHIRAILEKKHFDREHCDEKEFRRIYQYLLRRGFSSNDILREMK